MLQEGPDFLLYNKKAIFVTPFGMKFLLSHRHKLLYTRHEIPFHYRSKRIPGTQPSYVKGDFGDYLTQIVTGERFCIQFNIFTILTADTWLHPFVARSLITLHLMLQGSVRCRLKGFGEAWLHEGSYSLFYIPDGRLHDAWFEPGVYLSFHIDLSPQFLQRLAMKYPELKEVLERLRRRSGEGVRQHSTHITHEIIRLIEEMKHCPYKEEPDKSWYLETRIRELLGLYVQDRPTAKEKLFHRTAFLMKKIDYYLESHLDEHLTIPGIAQRFYLSKSTLQRWFTQYFNKPFHQYLLERRMQQAQILLRETDMTLLEIAIKTGYRDAASFSHAFTRYTGEAPGHYRKNRN